MRHVRNRLSSVVAGLVLMLLTGLSSPAEEPGSELTVTAPPEELQLDPFYKKYLSAHGYPIISSKNVDDYALKEAGFLANLMLAKRPDVRKAMIDSGSMLIIMSEDEFTTDVPHHAHLKPKDFWDARARGLGGSQTDPVCSCGEENLLCFEGDPYSTENILIHEFAHNIHLRGLVNIDDTFDQRLKQAYDLALHEGLWKTKYASTNHHEYWAEGVQSWFDNNREDDHDHNHVNTRAELKDYDPRLAALCEEVFGETELVYSKPVTRLQGHLKGYDPKQSPKFVWPERLTEVKAQIRRDAENRGKNTVERSDSYNPQHSAIVKAEMIYDDAPFPQCHASTIIEKPSGGFMAAWFGGTHENHPDVGIWVAETDDAGNWSEPVEVANGIQHNDLRYPCWNPVLFARPASAETDSNSPGVIDLYYKCGPNPREWWGLLMTKTRRGWSLPRRLPEGIDGPVKNKPILLDNGTLLCGSSTEYDGWRVHFELTSDFGKTWKRVGPINAVSEFNIIQPAILKHQDGRLQIVCRSKEQFIVSSWSKDQGLTWSAPEKTNLPNPNSGIDAVTIKDGRHVLIYNNTPQGRSPLNLAVSKDGIAWTDIVVLESEPGEYSYPAVIQARDGLLHVTYTWKRQRIKHVVVDPEQL